MENTWFNFLKYKVASFTTISEVAEKYSRIFNNGPLNTKEFDDYVSLVGYENAVQVSRCESLTPIGWKARFFFNWLFSWDKEEWFERFHSPEKSVTA